MADGVRKIYLCGPIMDAESERSAKDWRTRAKERLAGRFILLDPLRRNFRDREIDSANEIVDFDLQDVRDADLLLVNYSKPSLGTAMEVFYAGHDLGKFVIAFSPFSFRRLLAMDGPLLHQDIARPRVRNYLHRSPFSLKGVLAWSKDCVSPAASSSGSCLTCAACIAGSRLQPGSVWSAAGGQWLLRSALPDLRPAAILQSRKL